MTGTAAVSYASTSVSHEADAFDSSRCSPRIRRELSPVSATLTGALVLLAVNAVEPSAAKAASWATTESAISLPRAPDARSTLVSQIVDYRYMPENWDGEGGHGPSVAAINEAINFLDLLPLGALAPRSSVAGDGETGFYWRTENDFIDVSFYGDGTIYYYARVRRMNLDTASAEPFSGRALPPILAEAIANI